MKTFGFKYVNVCTNNVGSEAQLTERQFLLEEPPLNMENSLVYGTGARRSQVFRQKRKI